MSRNAHHSRPGRNDPCPCGSGKKFKKCHGAVTDRPKVVRLDPSAEIELRKIFDRQNALEIQRQKQQGLGKPIISNIYKDHRFIAIGKELHWSEKWKTFHDVLFDYLKICFGKDWWFGELEKAAEKKHPIMTWAELSGKYTTQNFNPSNGINVAPTIGAIDAYLGLSYNLYLLAHNVELQKGLLNRLKNPDQFLGAYYETFVAATFIKAGFEIKLEDETDTSTSHCEFVATYRQTGKSFSVEAKARKQTDPSPNIGFQLYKALRKQADFPRVVFIELNSHQRTNDAEVIDFIEQISSQLRELEQKITIKNNPAPSAYVFLTNFPYQFNLEATDVKIFAFAEGYKIPEFNKGLSVPNIREALRIRSNHFEIFQLMRSLSDYSGVPSTFDGEIPEIAFGGNTTRLKIGERYIIPDKDGKEVIGELVEAIVAWDKAVGIYKLEDTRTIMVTSPLTKDELVAYHKFPDTFFGKYKQRSRKAESPLDLFDFFFETYRQTDREKLLDLLNKYSDIDSLRELNQEELAIIFCERSVYSMMKKENSRK